MIDFEKYGPMHSDMREAPTEAATITMADIVTALTLVQEVCGSHPIGGLRLLFCACGEAHRAVEITEDEDGKRWISVIA